MLHREMAVFISLSPANGFLFPFTKGGLMKTLVFCAGLLLSVSAFANTVEIRASEHTCTELAQAIRHYGRVFIRMGIGGRSFRYPPNTCSFGEKYASIYFLDMNDQKCLLDYACVRDPQSPH
jgi:hypothetical protein